MQTVVKMVKRTPSPDQAPAQVRDPAPPDKPNDNQPKQTESAQDTTTMLVGSPSRGVYVLKKKMELLPKSTTPKLFALKLFELVFNREEARGGSVEGEKGDNSTNWTPTVWLPSRNILKECSLARQL